MSRILYVYYLVYMIIVINVLISYQMKMVQQNMSVKITLTVLLAF